MRLSALAGTFRTAHAGPVRTVTEAKERVMQLDLSIEEADALRAVLERHVSDMYAEISHTDNPTFRAQLRDERALLRGVLERIPA